MFPPRVLRCPHPQVVHEQDAVVSRCLPPFVRFPRLPAPLASDAISRYQSGQIHML